MADSSDHFIWQIIGEKKFCSFKRILEQGIFCKNKFNLTGLCSRQSCPLSNSKYATIIEKEGVLYLIKKDQNKSNLPNRMWKKITLSRNFVKAVQQININLSFWPKFFLHFTKIKLTKLTQISIRFQIKKIEDIFVDQNVNSLFEKNFRQNLGQIKVEKVVETELLNRLNMGIYGNLYSGPPFSEKRDEYIQKKNKAYAEEKELYPLLKKNLEFV